MATACVLVALLTGAAFAYASLAGNGELSRPKKSKALKVTGHVDNLQPGVPTVLAAKVRNNLEHRLKMRSLKAVIGDASADCPRTMLQARRVRTRKTLKPRRTRNVPITVTLSASAPDACQGARFPIRFKAKAALRKHTH